MKKTILFCLLAVLCLQGFAKKPKAAPKQVYLMGVGISLNDSTLYITPIQSLSDVTLEPKTGFLENRTFYSLQLKNHMEAAGIQNAICATLFDTDEKALNKKLAKITQRRNKKNIARIVYIHENEFSYKPYTVASEADEDVAE
ncbi:MAG: hypothetical protein IJ553_00970 [Alloprevotella sp.]|nr:hypothetical protein [Alloprevotella sp.]